MNAQQLKNSILQEAIEGRLVPQDPNDEPASALLQRIREEKKRLVKEGKLKKKDLEEKPISEDEIPFEIPESWEWTRLGNVLSKLTDGSHNPPPNSGIGYPVISAMNIRNGEITLDNVQRYVTEQDFLKENPRTNISRGDIILGIIGGSIGNIAIYNHDTKVIAQRSIAIMTPLLINHLFTLYILKSPLVVTQLSKYASGSAQGGVYLGNLKQLLLPLPPLAEQKRIVAKIEELMPKVEEYGKAQEALDKLNAELPEKLKKSILQEAIEGRLVPQDPNDEPASVLLDKIRKEKARLIKEKKIILSKPEKKCKDIEPEDFSIPSNWTWCILNDICRTFGRIGFRGYTKEDLRYSEKDGAITLSPTNIIEGKLDVTSCTYLSWEKYDESPEIQVKENDIILVKTASIGKCAIVKELKHEMTVNPQFVVIKDIKIHPDYLYYLLRSPYIQDKFQNYAIGTSIPTFSQVNLISMKIPLPPLAEQHRIVKKIEELLGKIDLL